MTESFGVLTGLPPTNPPIARHAQRPKTSCASTTSWGVISTAKIQTEDPSPGITRVLQECIKVCLDFLGLLLFL
jgi:hypothetical protein